MSVAPSRRSCCCRGGARSPDPGGRLGRPRPQSGARAALALGAQGIRRGTAFLATAESFAHYLLKRRVVAAASADTVHTDAFAINWPADSPVRVLASAVTESRGGRLFGYRPGHIPRGAIAEEEGRSIYLFSTDSPLHSMTGDLERLALFAGQSAGRSSGSSPRPRWSSASSPRR